VNIFSGERDEVIFIWLNQLSGGENNKRNDAILYLVEFRSSLMTK
jgi:hypothetical protein